MNKNVEYQPLLEHKLISCNLNEELLERYHVPFPLGLNLSKYILVTPILLGREQLPVIIENES